MANVPVYLGSLDLGALKEVLVQVPYEASDRLWSRIARVRVVSHNIHRGSATTSTHRVGGKETLPTECGLDGDNLRTTQESYGNRERRAARQ